MNEAIAGFIAIIEEQSKEIEALQAELAEKEIEIDHQEQDNLTLQAKAKAKIEELEAANYQMAMDRAVSERKVIILTEGHKWGFCEECEKIAALQEEANKNMEELCRARADALVMALRLFGEDDSTFGPECHEVMKKWGQIAVKEIAG